MSEEQEKIIYEPHPVSPKRKKELRQQGYRIIDEKFKPKGLVEKLNPFSK